MPSSTDCFPEIDEMNDVKTYDKAKWHDDSVAEHGLPEEHASHHIVFFFRWCIERDLISDWVRTSLPDDFASVRDGRHGVLDFFEQVDRCFVNDMLSDEGNAFAAAYFEYTTGQYLGDLVATLQGTLPSEYHIPFNEDTYRRMKSVIDQRYNAWRAGESVSKRKWWQFWK